jgi:ubiquinone/menaquinone biosynthesis C-methylase UbiE
LNELYGIDTNERLFERMSGAFPEPHASATTQVGPAQEILEQYPNNYFDVVYTSAVLIHIQSDTPALFSEIERASGGILITVENESLEPIPEDQHDAFITGNKGLNYITLRNCGGIFTEPGMAEVTNINAWEEGELQDLLKPATTSGF